MSGTENVRRRRNILAASVAAGVLLAGGGGVYLAVAATASGEATPSGADSKVADAAAPPPPLRLGGGSGGPGIAPGEPDPGGGPNGTVYTSKGPLPPGPSSAAVHRPEGLVTSAEVTRLAEALGIEGRPVLVGDVWTIRPEKDGQGPRLDVAKAAPGSWTYSWYDGAPVGDSCLKGKACPPPGETKPSRGGSPVSEAAAKAAAVPVLKAIGQDDAKVTATQVMDGSVRVVNADPVVGGLPTHGWSTGLRIGPDGRAVSGSGTLKEPVKGDTYPVVGAEKALAELNEESKGTGPIGIGGCATDPPAGVDGNGKDDPAGVDGNGKDDPTAPCQSIAEVAPPTEVPVTAAVFGLAAQDVAGERLLVPAWLFTADPVDAAPYTVTETAVAPEHLAPSAKPSPPDEGTAPARQIESYRTAEDGRKLTVTFWGGVCSTYTAKAVETPEKVTVRIDEKSDPGRACIAIAKEITLTVTLQSPLGDRAVVDAASGQAVPRR
ncbi:hypothetical protein [Streptomyces tanashiensis]|uniref:hypothetical protein n=1 Tax=Streptomyces tanashiensis TaxID=67367 RepID=UPI00167DAC08|nr:hypothetical protein [Streptomyces tanashiensis]GGY12858.1 membrane protein [Streptomyces tanashiensis]